MKKLVNELYTDADFDAMIRLMTETLSIAEEKGTTLSKKQLLGGRRLGPARRGYCNLIEVIARNNLKELPRDKDPEELHNLLHNYDRLAIIRGLAMKFNEWMDDSMKATGMDAVALTDTFSASLELARRDNDGLDLEMGEVEAYQKRFANKLNQKHNGEETDLESAMDASPQ